jgi:UDP-N-acetylmuramoyl-tripeptide--D-alanyl-D-alanine ligase
MPVIAVDDALAGLTRAAAAQRARFAGKVIAVAGSNGKTTVKEMIARVLSRAGTTLATAANLNNHIGVPLTLLRLESQHFAVIEVGANHPGEVAELARLVRPDVGIVTNAGAEHLEGFGSLEGVARAEGELFAELGAAGTAVINADDAFAPLWRELAHGRHIVGFGSGVGADVRAESIHNDIDDDGFVSRFALIAPPGRTQIELRLAGMHNVVNACGATAAALAVGADLTHAQAGLAAMQPVPGRLQFKRAAQGAWIIDDSYNANPSSMCAALDVLGSLPGRRWFVFGEMGELGAHSAAGHLQVATYARAQGVERLLGFGLPVQAAVEAFGPGGSWFSSIEALQAEFANGLSADLRLLIKGSRVNRLERLVNFLLGAADPRRKAG